MSPLRSLTSIKSNSFICSILITTCWLLIPSEILAKTFEPTNARIDFCNSYEVMNDRVIFGKPHLLLSDYKSESSDSSYSGHSSEGLIVSSNSKDYAFNEDFFVNSLLTLRAKGNPISINNAPDKKARYCVILENKAKEKAILNAWRPTVLAHTAKTLVGFYDFLDNKSTESIRKNGTVTERVVRDAFENKVITEYHFDELGKPRAVFYTVKGAKKAINETLLSKWRLTLRDSPEINALELGLLNYFSNENTADSNTGISATPVKTSQRVSVQYSYKWDETKSIVENLRLYVINSKKIGAYIHTVTESQLQVDAVEDILRARNPDFDLAMLCYLTHKDSPKCNEHKKYRMPIAPIIDKEWQRNINYQHWLDVTKKVLMRHNKSQIEIDQIRVKPIPFYQVAFIPRFLVEVSPVEPENGRYYFISSQKGKASWWLDGTANPILEHNESYDLKITNAEQALAYLKFFTSSFTIYKTPYYLLDLPKQTFPGLKKGQVDPPRLIGQTPNSWTFRSHFIFGATYGWGEFTVSSSGSVTLGHEQSSWANNSNIIINKAVFVKKNGLRTWDGFDEFKKVVNFQ